MCVCVVRLVALCVKQIHTREILLGIIDRKLAYDYRAVLVYNDLFRYLLSRFYYYTDICTEKFYQTNQFLIKSRLDKFTLIALVA